MSGLTPGGWPFAVDDDFAIEWPAVSEALALRLEQRTSTTFATPAARDAAIPAPTAGMTCFVTSLGQHQGWKTGGWYPIGGTMPGLAFQRNVTGSMPAGWARQQSTAGTVVTARYFGGTASANGNNDGFITVPVAGNYLVTVEIQGSLAAGLQLTAGFGPSAGSTPTHSGGWNVVGATAGNVLAASMTQVLSLVPATPYAAFANGSAAGWSLFAWQMNITWVGTL